MEISAGIVGGYKERRLSWKWRHPVGTRLRILANRCARASSNLMNVVLTLMICRSPISCLILMVFFTGVGLSQDAPSAPNGSEASPEMSRLDQALAGDWNNVETMERSEFFPQGGGRLGTSHCGLTTGGVTLVCEGNSDGSAAKRLPFTHLSWGNQGQRDDAV